ncbi:MAG: prepilin-type N-terminal cleavage/methylation domain-containing protein [Thermoguttaceae bacterium]
MKRLASSLLCPVERRGYSHRSGYTLIEILVATTLSLLLLGAVVAMFGRVGNAITDSRSMLEAADRLRLAGERMQLDLAGVTVTMNPPRDPANNEGYLEIIEGPATGAASSIARTTDATGTPTDMTVGDFDDILMLTTRSTGRPFVGKFNNTSAIQSDVAEVAWFVRGRTLHRRVLLVAPSAFTTPVAAAGFYTRNDISVHLASASTVVPNTLGDLTRRECRFAHQKVATTPFPYDIRALWHWSVTSVSGTFPTLPTLNECTANGWIASLNSPATALPSLDFWTNNPSSRLAENALSGGAAATRVADDVILTNVIGFDVKVWDPTAPNGAGGQGAYVDLGYHNDAYASAISRFSHFGHPNSHLLGTANTAKTYDTWSTHYETVGTGLMGDLPGRALNGLDDTGGGVVDSDADKLTSPPYPCPLRSVQVKIRTFEPDSKQIRETTIVQDFLPQ